ncbi:MAG: ABC transporter permease [Athalassotoga sp.]
MKRKNKMVKEETDFQRMMKVLLKNPFGVAGMIILIIMYTMTLFAQFISPYNFTDLHSKYTYLPPTPIHWIDSKGHFHLIPFVYGIKEQRNPVTYAMEYVTNKNEIYPIRFFVHGESYKFLGLFKTNLHLFGIDPDAHGMLALFGTDEYGRDLFSRTIVGGQVSLTVGLLGIAISFSIGIVVGSLSGFLGGTFDLVIQRLIEILMSFPTLPLWLALSMIIPPSWPSTWVYFGIVTVLSVLGWTGLARVIRGMTLSIKEKDFISAAKLSGQSNLKIIIHHILPNIISYVIVVATLSIPGMILAESAMSFLGLGIKEPMTSWGLLLSNAESLESIELHPWFLIPGAFIIVAVLSFVFVGDSLRDAFDPYQYERK